jgi:hypothetical protein
MIEFYQYNEITNYAFTLKNIIFPELKLKIIERPSKIFIVQSSTFILKITISNFNWRLFKYPSIISFIR